MEKTNKSLDRIKKFRNAKKDGDLSNFVFGKVQPQALPLEEAVLGAIMLDKDAVTSVLDILSPSSFYSTAHELIYKAMLVLFEKSHPIDILTVTDQLTKTGDLETVGGAYAIVELTNRVTSSANVEYHARIVAQKYIQRSLIKSSTKIIQEAYEDTTDVFDLLDKAEQELFAITQQNLSRSFESMGVLASRALKNLEELSQREEGLTGVPSGFVSLDRVTSGFQPSDLIIVAGRPGMGKTSFILSLARNTAVDFGKGIAIFSLEMSNLQLVQRLISLEAEIEGSKLRNGRLEDYEWQQLQSAVERLSEAPIYIDDTPGINIFELRAKCRRLKKQYDIDMVVIDYLQLMTGASENNRSGNREQEISNISRSLKGLAKELNVPVIALAQLSRAVETRGGTKRPQLSDLRECVTGDTLIYLPESGKYKRVDELIDLEHFQVLAMDEEYRLQSAKCIDVWETGEKDIFEVVTQSGFKIRTSLNHPFFTVNGWQQLVDLKEGDYVATSRIIKSNSKSDLKDGEIIMLAHMIGDGCYVDRQPIHYTSQEQASLDIVEQSAKELWNIKGRRIADRNSERCFQLYLPSPYHLTHNVRHPFVNLLRKVGLEKARSYEKKIPATIFESSNDQIALFISHLWSTDGGVHIRVGKASSSIHYSSNSWKLVNGLKSLLLRFGIHSSIQKTQKSEYKPNYNLLIRSKENILRFASQINIFGSKSIKIAKLIATFENANSVPNSDVISKNIWTKIKLLKSEKGYTERSFQSTLGMQYCGSALYKSNLSRQRLAKIASILDDEDLNLMANSEIKWEKIKSITHVSKEMTYDLHVENHHNFVANNFIVHNSGAIEQDADIVSFVYRPEYYKMYEDEQGNSLKGVAEIIIAKHRNGSLEDVRLKFTSHFAKFSDIDDNFDDLLGDNSNDNPIGNTITRPSSFNDLDDDTPF